MNRNRIFTSALFFTCAFALLLTCLLSAAPAAAAGPAYVQPPDQMVYFRPGPREVTISVKAVNSNFPGLPYNLNYLKQTIEMLQGIGYEVPNNAALAAVQVRATVKYTQVDNRQAVSNEVGSKVVGGAILGALSGLAGGGGGQGAAEGAAGGAAYGVASGAQTPPVLRYVTVQFEISSKKSGSQIGQVTKDVTSIEMGPAEMIDAIIADYLQAAFPARQ